MTSKYRSFIAVVCCPLATLLSGAATADDLPYVPGVALLQAVDELACISGPQAPLTEVLDNLPQRFDGVRTVSMSFSNLVLLDGTAESIATERPDRDPTVQRPTVHLSPDDRIFREIATCADPTTVPPTLPQIGNGRIWKLQVSGSVDAPEVALPSEWSTYAPNIALDNQVLGTCVLMGGGLPRQPAQAAVIAGALESQIAASLPEGSGLNRHATRLATDLLQPSALRLRGWDLILMSGALPDDIPEADVCSALLDLYVGDENDAPTLGPDPTDTLSTCPADGLIAGQVFRTQILFDGSSSTLTSDAETLLDALRSCIASSTGNLSLTIEGYASVDGGAQRNWTRSRLRADAVREALNEVRADIAVTSGGFGETAVLDDTREGNRAVFVTLQATPTLESNSHSADTILLRRYLEPDLTCNQLNPALTGDLLPWLDGEFGKSFMSAVSAPDFVILFHNAPDSVGFARALQNAAAEVSSCSAPRSRAPHVGFLYRRTGLPFWQSPKSTEPLTDDPVTDYFILPPKITWIYPVDTTPDFAALRRAAEEYGIVSQNLGDLAELDEAASDDLFGQVDVLTYTIPAPVSEVLNALARANAGTGWVNLTAGWQ